MTTQETHAGVDHIDAIAHSVELREKYPIAPLAEELGISYRDEIPPGDVAYQSDWSGLAVRRDSELGWMLWLPFMERVKGVGQLGPNKTTPYPYTHTIFDHEAEQLVRGVSHLAWLAQTQEPLFLEGTSATYRAPNTDSTDHTRFILRVAAWWFCLHDAESLPLRDSAKFAFATRGTITDENILLVQRLADPLDTKYRPYLQEIFGDRLDDAIAILTSIAQRTEPSFLGDFLHSRPLPDECDPSGASRPLDADRTTYTIQDLFRVFGLHMFSPTINPNQNATELFPYTDMLYLALNLTALQTILRAETDSWAQSVWKRLYFPMKIHPSQIDLLCSAVLAKGWDGNVHVAYRDPEEVFNFFTLSSLGNFPGLYLTPEMIFMEKQFEHRIRRHSIKWSIARRNKFIRRIRDWTDEGLLAWLTKYWPDTVGELSSTSHDTFVYKHDYVYDPDEMDYRAGNVVSVPIKIHPGTATLVLNEYGIAVPFSSYDPAAARDFHADLARYHGKWLAVRRYRKRRGERFFSHPA